MAKANIPNLDSFLQKKVRITLKGSTPLVGTIEGYDSFSNISLTGLEGMAGCSDGVVRGDAIERIEEWR